MTRRRVKRLVRIDVIALLACACSSSSTTSHTTASEVVGPCPEADAAMPLAPRRDAGLVQDASPLCLAPDAGTCPATDLDASPPQPDPATWLCYVDSECAVFSNAPYCDGDRCSPAQRAVTCVTAAQQTGGFPNPEVAHTYTGTNGTFADHCDANGNLVDYQCESTWPPCGPGPNGCDGPLVYTGRVIPTVDGVVDCLGTCHGARCDARCPQQGDQLTWMGENAVGNVVIHNDTDGRAYACTLGAGPPMQTTFDCARATAGRTGFVQGLGLTGSFCTGAAFGSIAVAIDGVAAPKGGYACSYECGIVPSCTPF